MAILHRWAGLGGGDDGGGGGSAVGLLHGCDCDVGHGDAGVGIFWNNIDPGRIRTLDSWKSFSSRLLLLLSMIAVVDAIVDCWRRLAAPGTWRWWHIMVRYDRHPADCVFRRKVSSMIV